MEIEIFGGCLKDICHDVAILAVVLFMGLTADVLVVTIVI